MTTCHPADPSTQAPRSGSLRLSFVLGFLAACAPPPAPAAPECPAAPEAPKAVAEAEAPRLSPDTVVARWQGGELRYGELVELLEDELVEQGRAAARARFSLEQSALRDIVARKVMTQAARAEGKTLDAYLVEIRRGITVSDEEVKAFFDENLAEEGPPFEAFADRIREHLIEEKMAVMIQERIASLNASAGVSLQLAPPPEAVADLDLEGRPSLGPADAEVTVVVFEDFECPFCAEARHTLHDYVKTYPGKVRVVFMHYPLEMHPAARDAAIAAECAHRQGRFWDMYEALFAQSDELVPGAAAMRPFAEELGLDLPRFEACMANSEVADQVEDDVDQGDEAGVEGTPSVFINGIAADGLPTVAQLAVFL